MSTPDPDLELIAESRLPTRHAEFRIGVYRSVDGKEHVVLSLGDLDGDPPLVRVHSECLTGDALFSQRCDCGAQLESALQQIAAEGRGAVLYLRQEGRGIGLGNKIRAYALQDRGADTVEANHQLGFPADAREYGLAVQLLHQLGLCRIRLMTNNPRKLDALRADGIDVIERVAVESGRNPHNEKYLAAKAAKLGHWLTLP
ncbi:GTP cyclohydrolase II [Sinimarinibacterium flocculans]|uniref:GTP cyclohydrolase-2 n=1 Tax=Sinimarinibacterium flocculans TaxID=985250 RepID=A0A318EIQ4_9GAMM|nr:GTP cyclohydrolase II [Sinimarinibacterium flocculans]PXV68594.1 GTP cyclohydrolase II [Sinimarinibacterium flocculans]